MDIRRVVAHKIKMLIEERQLTRSSFGELIDVGPGEVGKLVSGVNNTTIETIQKIAEKTNKPFAYFFEPVPGADYSPQPAEVESKKVHS